MNNEIERLHEKIASGIYAARPEIKWSKGVFRFISITLMSSGKCIYTLADGTAMSGYTAFEVDDAFAKLRTEMANLDKDHNAWYSAICEVTPDGKFSFIFDYDHLPMFKYIPSPSKWLDEFEKYPRPGLQEKIQDWIDGKADADAIVKRLGSMQYK